MSNLQKERGQWSVVSRRTGRPRERASGRSVHSPLLQLVPVRMEPDARRVLHAAHDVVDRALGHHHVRSCKEDDVSRRWDTIPAPPLQAYPLGGASPHRV